MYDNDDEKERSGAEQTSRSNNARGNVKWGIDGLEYLEHHNRENRLQQGWNSLTEKDNATHVSLVAIIFGDGDICATGDELRVTKFVHYWTNLM